MEHDDSNNRDVKTTIANCKDMTQEIINCNSVKQSHFVFQTKKQLCNYL